jgi:HK97 family phage portal protein
MLAELITGGIRGMQRLASSANPDQWLIDWTRQGEPTAAGEAITEENALNCPAVGAAVSALSESMMVLSPEVCREDKSGNVEVCKDHDLQPVLSRMANPETTDATFFDTEQNHLGTYGNSFAEIQRTIRGNRVVALWNRSPKPERTRPVRSKLDGKIYYQCHDAQGQLQGEVPAADMLHVKYFSMDGILGKSPVRMIREAIGGNRAAERFANELFKNGDAAQGYFTHPGKLGEAAYARLKKSLAEQAEHGARHGKHILEEGMKFDGTSYDFNALQLIDARVFLIKEVCRRYRITPHLLQILEGGGATVTELGRQFVIFTLLPWCKRWTSEMNAKLLTWPYFVRFNFAAFLRNDPLALSSQHRIDFAIGKKSVNEMRHESGDNQLDEPWANEHFVPLNMVPLSKAGEMGLKGNPAGGDPEKPMPAAPAIADGVQPAMPNGQDGGRPEKQGKRGAGSGERGASEELGTQLALLEAEAVIAETFRRLSRIEANEALRAAKEPQTFAARIEKFYLGHVDTLREALTRPVRTAVLLRDGPLCGGLATDTEVEIRIQEHVAARRAAVLAAAVGKPGDLPARVAATVQNWGKE